ncbi:MAG: [LysW]-aminoadipate kinase [Chloroflexi bacterium]|nr:[LysW]-aminoadipate kinase [Chloroflexota bacterium]
MTGERLLVVKLGGGAGLDLAAACDELAAIAQQRPLVVVHGVSAAMNQLCAELGVAVQTLTSPSGHSSRYTPPATRDVYVRAAEQANAELVAELRRREVDAVGFVGADVAVHGSRKRAIRAVMNGRIRMVRDDCSGAITQVEAAALHAALAQGQVPVLPPMAASADGLLNVDGDRAGAAVAGALGASALVILSNVRGLYRNYPNEDSFVEQIALSDIGSALDWAQGRMKRKVLAAQEALTQGVSAAVIGDGRVSNPVSRALRGEGTRFSP